MSGLPSRLKPRWSRLGELFLLAWSIAGLSFFRAIVSVGPPFWARFRTFGFLLTRSPLPAKPHVSLSSRLWLEDFTAASQLEPVVAFPFATIVFSRLADPEPRRLPPFEELVPSAVLATRVAL